MTAIDLQRPLIDLPHLFIACQGPLVHGPDDFLEGLLDGNDTRRVAQQ